MPRRTEGEGVRTEGGRRSLHAPYEWVGEWLDLLSDQLVRARDRLRSTVCPLNAGAKPIGKDQPSPTYGCQRSPGYRTSRLTAPIVMRRCTPLCASRKVPPTVYDLVAIAIARVSNSTSVPSQAQRSK